MFLRLRPEEVIMDTTTMDMDTATDMDMAMDAMGMVGAFLDVNWERIGLC